MSNIINDQKLAYEFIKNSVKNDSISHAYLINTNNYSFAWDFVLDIVKYFLCPNHFSEKDCFKCDLCRRIEDNNYPEFKVIDTDGIWIKKNQIMDLQNDFNKIALEGKKRVYVIKNAERMNQQTSNSILKFLEEPSNDIIAILVTNNLNLLLPTIVSRCQLINLKNNFDSSRTSFEKFAYLCIDSNTEFDNFISDKNNKKLFDDILHFIEFYENNGNDSIVFSKEIWHSKFKDRVEIVKVFDLIINFYYDVLLFKSSGKTIFFSDNLDLIENISNKNKISDIIRKLNVSINCKDKIKYNINFNLFFDKFILLLGGGF